MFLSRSESILFFQRSSKIGGMLQEYHISSDFLQFKYLFQGTFAKKNSLYQHFITYAIEKFVDIILFGFFEVNANGVLYPGFIKE